MAIKRSDQQRNSRYAQGGTVDIQGNWLGWWERRIYPKSDSDIPVTISSRYARRPDLMAADFYGTANLQWFVLQYNTISDINTEFIEGSKLVLPTKSRLFGELLTRSQ